DADGEQRERLLLVVVAGADQRRRLLPVVGRAAVGDEENPRAVIAQAGLLVDLLALLEHGEAALDRLAHRRLAAGAQGRRHPDVRRLELALDLDRAEGND